MRTLTRKQHFELPLSRAPTKRGTCARTHDCVLPCSVSCSGAVDRVGTAGTPLECRWPSRLCPCLCLALLVVSWMGRQGAPRRGGGGHNCAAVPR
ncbi:hypothetical protein NDU88_010033 [Pleurodeles waltl]|uniref:Uncharacterized protein n=1 Tax=Pleurodeles waltl TaxID=8319 RepID=A0AAV7QZ49_PLEWA|nr:hypothetical protein NDU88_010033 [Pleurodeles waltl]